jgi:hypothetical protein
MIMEVVKFLLNLLFFFTKSKIVIFVTIFLISACANIGVITGGEKDETPPRVVKEIPENFKKNFDSKTIIIQFDEYLATTNLRSEITISPEPDFKPVYFIKGKNLIIKFDGELKPNTTYTISFGRGIADLNENNVLFNYTYVFSTGSFIDSNSIYGYVRDIVSLKPAVGFLVGLIPYSETSLDSLVFKKPRYYSLSDSIGFFKINYLPSDSFFILTFEDKNKSFQLQQDVENAGFLPLKLSSDTALVVLYSAPQIKKPRPLMAKLTSDHSMYFTYQVPIKNISVRDVKNYEDINFFKNQTADTIEVFFNNLIKDSVLVEVKSELGTDTILLRKREPLKGKIALKQISRSQISGLDSLVLFSNFPISHMDTTKISIFQEDTLPISFKDVYFDERIVVINFNKKPNSSYKIRFLPGAVFFNSSVYNEDTLFFAIKVLQNEDFGILRLHISLDTLPKGTVLKLMTGNKTLFQQTIKSEFLDLVVENLLPGNYSLQLFVDENEDGLWNAGDIFSGKLPEPILLYPEEISLRANWELDIEWTISIKELLVRFVSPQ